MLERERGMTPAQHIRQARDFLAQADLELAAGDDLQASEKLWGAATHALRAHMAATGVKNGKHRDLKEAAEQLAESRRDPRILVGFAVAQKFHANFYTGFMEDHEIEAEKVQIHDFVNRVLTDTPPAERASSPPSGPPP